MNRVMTVSISTLLVLAAAVGVWWLWPRTPPPTLHTVTHHGDSSAVQKFIEASTTFEEADAAPDLDLPEVRPDALLEFSGTAPLEHHPILAVILAKGRKGRPITMNSGSAMPVLVNGRSNGFEIKLNAPLKAGTYQLVLKHPPKGIFARGQLVVK